MSSGVSPNYRNYSRICFLLPVCSFIRTESLMLSLYWKIRVRENLYCDTFYAVHFSKKSDLTKYYLSQGSIGNFFKNIIVCLETRSPYWFCIFYFFYQLDFFFFYFFNRHDSIVNVKNICASLLYISQLKLYILLYYCIYFSI